MIETNVMNPNGSKNENDWSPFIAIGAAITVLSIVWGLLAWLEVIDGAFGDAFGALNALFSGLAFAGVIVAIHLQRKELALQRDELTLTREELRRTAEAQEQSVQALRDESEARMRAYIRVRLQPPGRHSPSWAMIVANTGSTDAWEVQLTCSTNFWIKVPGRRQFWIRNLPIFSGTKFTMTPGFELRYEIPTDPEGDEHVGMPLRFHVQADYTISAARRVSETTELDSRMVEGTTGIPDQHR